MDISTILAGLLIAALLYLHIKQSDLIFQHDIKVAKILAVILLCVLAVGCTLLPALSGELSRDENLFWAFASSAVVWVLSVIVFWKILSGCQKDAFFKRIGEPGQSLREKIKGILLEVVKKNQFTPAFKLFIATRFEDPVINSISDKCTITSANYMNGGTTGPVLRPEDIEKLKALAEQLG